eukprot:gb/GECH01014142.1/.p1 GENE.gb/GECH01014142.1/~~gb/GECH01014142.1/.p1  ORF type:complete len:329 (+),score=75.83 gb/GECH01014142.1/:1-987(+)
MSNTETCRESTLEDITNKLRALNQSPTTRHEALCLVLYATMIAEGFRCVGLSESEPESEHSADSIPQDWNSSTDAYSFRFCYGENTERYIVKCVTLGSTILVHALVEPGQYSLPPLEINLDDYLRTDVTWNIDNIQRGYFKSPEAFQQFINAVKMQIARELVPSSSSSSSSATGQASRDDQERRPPPQPEPRQPPPRDYDPLRETGPERTPYGVGAEDLYPGGFAPRIPGAPSMRGGTQVGPDHPMFGGVRDPYVGNGSRPGMGGPRIPPGSVPPGARFDPFGPPPMYPRGGGPGPRRSTRGDPDPDHFPPPGEEGGDERPDIPGWYI